MRIPRRILSSKPGETICHCVLAEPRALSSYVLKNRQADRMVASVLRDEPMEVGERTVTVHCPPQAFVHVAPSSGKTLYPYPPANASSTSSLKTQPRGFCATPSKSAPESAKSLCLSVSRHTPGLFGLLYCASQTVRGQGSPV